MGEKKHDKFPGGRSPKAPDPKHPHGGERRVDHGTGQHGQGRNPDPGHAAHSHTGQHAPKGGPTPHGPKKGEHPEGPKDDAEASCITRRLKVETQDLHDAAEQHELQRALFKGQLPREVYAQHLAQLLHVHRALEAAIREHRAGVPALARVVKDYQFQEPYLRDDLRCFGVDPEATAPTRGTARLIERIGRASREEPIALLGFHYVLEGSNNGSKYIAMNLRKAYGLRAGEGDRYLDPYGADQPARWAEFKADMKALGLSDAEKDRLVAAAREMFAGISAIGDDLLALPRA